MKNVFRSLLIFGMLSILFSCGSRKNTPASDITSGKEKDFKDKYFSAAKHKVLGEYDKAVADFLDALKHKPESHETMYEIASTKAMMGNFHDAIYWAEKALKTNKTYNYWYSKQLADLYNQSGDFLKSAAVYENMLKNDENREELYIELGNQYINMGDFKSATTWFEKYLDKFGLEPEGANVLVRLYAELGKPEKGIEWVEKLVAQYPDEIEHKVLLADLLLENNQIEKGKEILYSILSLKPNNGFAAKSLASIYKKEGKPDSNQYYLQMAFNDYEVSVDWKLFVVSGFFPQIKTDEKTQKLALQLTQSLVDVHNTNDKAYLAQGDVFHAVGQIENARKSLQKATSINPADIEFWRKLLSLDDEAKNNEWLAEDSENALEYFPNQAFLYIVNSFANYKIKNYEKAIETAQSGLEIAILKNDKTDLLATIADSYYDQKKFSDCFATYDEILEINPNDHLALNNYAYYLSEQNERLDKALEMIEKAIKLSPSRPTYVDTKGWVLFQMQKYSEAEVALKLAFEQLKQDEEVKNHYVACLRKLNKNAEADSIEASYQKQTN
ncbi:MAG: tetratricopeptide repeat protein [Flavobacteriales bacterium]|nr:tetratricopeptide repeat protein [Flavobacteriales bacterium]